MPTKTNRISLYRLRDPKRPNQLELLNAGYELISESNEQKLFVKFTHHSVPNWRTFISEQLAQSRRDVFYSSSSFVLLHDHANKRYAVTGGYGYLQIEKFAEKDFGIEVAKRLIGKDKISGLSQRIPRGELRQVLRTFTDYNPARDRDNFLRILQSIFGRGSFEGRSSRIEGKAAIILRTASRASDLQSVIEAVEEVLLREPALHFVQQFHIVNDIDLSTTLTATLQKQVVHFWSNKETRDNFYIEFDDSLQQFRTTVFKIGLGRTSIEVDDFDLDTIRDQLLASGIRINSEADLLRLRVTGFGEDGNVTINRSALWDHLIGELRVGNGDYLRFRGQWLCLLDQLRKVMTERISEIPVLSGELPVWDRAVLATELEYNQYVAEQNNWHCFDREFVQVGGYSRLELCDIYDPLQKRFIHVKETWGSKSSYLFSQGSVAGEFFHSDQAFREACCRRWPFLRDYPNSQGEIVFGVAASVDRLQEFPDNLTHFAKLSLCSAVDALQRLSYRVSLCAVPVR